MKSSTSNFKEKLSDIYKTGKSIKTTPKEIVAYFNATKRGWKIIDSVNQMMEEAHVFSEPPFRNAWFYGEIIIQPKPKSEPDSENGNTADKDPTPRISLLDAANIVDKGKSKVGPGLISVTRDTTIIEATTLMIMHNFSQLPILNGPKNIIGIVSWRSIGRALSLGKICNTVNDCKEDVLVLSYSTPLFDAVKQIQEHEVVLIQQKDKTISGIITSSDIAEQFIALSEPFLIIEQIENYLRMLLKNKYSLEELNTVITNEDGKKIQALSDLTFGQYILIIENKEFFERLNLKVDRGVIIERLELVRKIRNEVMHFEPEGITEEKLIILRQTAQFFFTLSNTLNLN